MESQSQSVEIRVEGLAKWARIASILVLGLSLFLGLMVVSGINGFVVPKFEKIFKDFNAQLPDATLLAINFSSLLREFWFVLLPLALAACVAIVAVVWCFKFWKTGLIGGLLLILLVIPCYVGFMVFTLYMPLVTLIQAARSSAGGH